MRSRFLVSLVGGVLVACAGSSAPPVASGPLDVNVTAVSASAPIATLPSPKMCEARMIAGEIDKRPSCKLDEKISSANGTLSYPCNGDGKVEARFAEQVFTGSLVHGEVTLEIVTTPGWGDGCEWESHQAIRGLISGAELAWTLSENVVKEKDDGSGCFGACVASATITIKRPD